MATPLDASVLGNFNIVFAFLLVFITTYAILATVVGFFKDNKGLAAIIALALSILTLFSNIAILTIQKMAPWFVLLFIFFFFVMIAYQVFGIKESTIVNILTKSEHSTSFAIWIITLVLIIGAGSLFTVLSEETGVQILGADLPEDEGEERTGFFAAITHPKILGVGLILMVAFFAIKFLAEQVK